MCAQFDSNHMRRREFIRNVLGASAALATTLRGELLLAADSSQAPTTGGKMLTRTIPASGQSLPVIGMGTWQTFDPPSLDAESLKPLEQVLRLFHTAGGRLVDSSPMYGKSEEVTGMLSSRLGINADLFVATKVWTTGENQGIQQIERSLSLLKRDRIELMQIHNLVDWQTHLKTLRAWKEAGKFRYIGITHYQSSALPELERVLRQEKFDFVQLAYSAEVRDAEKRLLPAARELGVAVLVNRPFESGGMFGRVRSRPLPDSIKPWADSWAQAFLKYVIAHPAVTCVIPATRNPKHMEDNLKAGFGRLPDEKEREQLIAALRG